MHIFVVRLCVSSLVHAGISLRQARSRNISDCFSCLFLSVLLLCFCWVTFLSVCPLRYLSSSAFLHVCRVDAFCDLQAALYPPRASRPCTPASCLCWPPECWSTPCSSPSSSPRPAATSVQPTPARRRCLCPACVLRPRVSMSLGAAGCGRPLRVIYSGSSLHADRKECCRKQEACPSVLLCLSLECKRCDGSLTLTSFLYTLQLSHLSSVVLSPSLSSCFSFIPVPVPSLHLPSSLSSGCVKFSWGSERVTFKPGGRRTRFLSTPCLALCV